MNHLYCSREKPKRNTPIKDVVRTHRTTNLLERIMKETLNIPPHLEGNIKVLPNGCWEWTGRITKKGYGVVGSSKLVHRVMAEANIGEIPPGMWVDHVCHNLDATCQPQSCQHRRCCNPEHLRIVTPRENLYATPNSPAFINSQKTHCKHGHPFAGDNLFYSTDGRGKPTRRCRICSRISANKYRAKTYV